PPAHTSTSTPLSRAPVTGSTGRGGVIHGFTGDVHVTESGNMQNRPPQPPREQATQRPSDFQQKIHGQMKRGTGMTDPLGLLSTKRHLLGLGGDEGEKMNIEDIDQTNPNYTGAVTATLIGVVAANSDLITYWAGQ